MTHYGSPGIRFIRSLIMFFVLALTLGATIACEKPGSTVYDTAPVQPGTYTGQATWTEEFMGETQVTHGENVQISIQGQGDAIDYFGVLGLAYEDKVVFDSRTEVLNDPTLLPGIFYTTTFTGEASGPTATIVALTRFFYADGSEAISPYKLTFKTYDLTGPRSLPTALPPETSYTYSQSSSASAAVTGKMPTDLSREGIHGMVVNRVRERLNP